MIRRFLKATLVSHHYDVFEATNGAEALKYAVSSHPDLIILDLGLPDMDGIDIASRITGKVENADYHSVCPGG